MKAIKTIMTLCLVALLMSCSGEKSKEVIIAGSVEGLADGTQVELFCIMRETVAEATVQGGKFELRTEVAEPTYLQLRVKDTFGFTPLMVDSGDKVTVSGTVTKQDTDWDWSGVKTEGASLNDELDEMLAPRCVLDDSFEAMMLKYSDLMEQIYEASMAGDNDKLAALEANEEYIAYVAAQDSMLREAAKVLESSVKENKSTFWAPLLMILQTSYLNEDMKYLYDMMDESAKNTIYGKYVKEQVSPEGLTGKAFPTFEGTLSDGKPTSFAKICEGKKYVLVDFWASWCRPCRNEIPNVKAQYDLYKDKGFEVVSISTDDDESAWRAALDEEQLPWPNLLGTSVTTSTGKPIGETYGIRYIPLMFLIDAASGTVIAENIRGEELATKLKELF